MSLLSARKTALFTGPQGPAGRDGAAGLLGPAGPPGPGALGQTSVSVSNGLNSNVATNGQPTLRLTGPTAAFALGGFSPPLGAPAAGQQLSVVNTTAQPMTVVNGDAGSSYPIQTGSGASISIIPRQSTVDFVFDGTSQVWRIKNTGLAYPRHLSVRDFGAVGDGQRVTDAAITIGTTLLTSASRLFTPADVTKLCTLYVAGSGTVEVGTITSYVGPTQVHVSFTETAGIASGGIFRWGTDNYAAILAALNAAVAATVSGFAVVAEVFFDPGEYCVNRGFALGTTYNGIRIRGASRGQREYVGAVSVMSRITLMSAATTTYLFLNTASNVRWSDLWLSGNRLATRVVDFEHFAVAQRFDNCYLDGAASAAGGHVLHFGNDAGQLEIDFIHFYECVVAGDLFDGTYFSYRLVYNENSNAFQITFHNGCYTNAVIGFEFLRGSCSFLGAPQFFTCSTAVFQIDNYCQNFTIEGAYSEGLTAPFLTMTNVYDVPGQQTVCPLRQCQLNGANPIYWNHSMGLSLVDVCINGNIYSNPAAAIAVSGLANGNQRIKSERTTFLNGHNFVYTSGSPGVLIEEIQTSVQNIAPTVVTDGAMALISGGTLTCSTSHPFASAALVVGLPVSVPGAGVGGVTLNTWIESWTSTSVVTLATACSTPVTGATVSIGAQYTEDGQQITRTRLNAPSEVVSTTGYDTTGMIMLACSRAQIAAGVPMIAADCHYIGTLTGNRTYTLSQLGAGGDFGFRMRVSRLAAVDGHTATIGFNDSVPTTLVLKAGAWAEFELLPNVGWLLVAQGAMTQTVDVQITSGGNVVVNTGIFLTAWSIVLVTCEIPAGTTTTTVHYGEIIADRVLGTPGTAAMTLGAFTSASSGGAFSLNTADTSVLRCVIIG